MKRNVQPLFPYLLITLNSRSGNNVDSVTPVNPFCNSSHLISDQYYLRHRRMCNNLTHCQARRSYERERERVDEESHKSFRTAGCKDTLKYLAVMNVLSKHWNQKHSF